MNTHPPKHPLRRSLRRSPTHPPTHRTTQVRKAVSSHHQRRIEAGEIKISPSYYVPKALADEIRAALKALVTERIAAHQAAEHT